MAAAIRRHRLCVPIPHPTRLAHRLRERPNCPPNRRKPHSRACACCAGMLARRVARACSHACSHHRPKTRETVGRFRKAEYTWNETRVRSVLRVCCVPRVTGYFSNDAMLAAAQRRAEPLTPPPRADTIAGAGGPIPPTSAPGPGLLLSATSAPGLELRLQLRRRRRRPLRSRASRCMT